MLIAQRQETLSSGGNYYLLELLIFAKLNDLSKEETLALFGAFYRDEVLKNPAGNDHQNIRNFMEFGWEGISFEGEALKSRF